MAIRKRNSEDFDSESSFLQGLLSPVVAVREWFADAIGGDDSLKTSESSLNSFLSILTLPFRLVFAVAVFMVQAWSTSRVGRGFILGLPAVLTVFACLSVGWLVTRYYNSVTVGRTNSNFNLHSRNPEAPPEYALMFAKKLVSLRPEDPNSLFRLGLSLASNEDLPGAVRVMNMLAPPELPEELRQERLKAPQQETLDEEEEKIGDYLPAHLWLSRYYQKQLFEDGFSPQIDSLAEKHLLRASEQAPENRQLAISLASLHELRALEVKETDPAAYLTQLKEMEKSLTDAIKPPLVSLQQVAQIPKLIQTKRTIAEIDENQNFEQNKAEFERLFDGLIKLSRKTQDSVRLQVVRQVIIGYVQLKEFDKAVEIIKDSLQSFDDIEVKKQLQQNAGIVFLKNAEDNSDLDDIDQYKSRLTSICACLNATVRERRAYKMLIGFIRHNQLHPEKFEWLQDTLLDTPKLAVNHLLIGCQLVHTGVAENDEKKIRQGTSHWKIAYKVEPQAQQILSNIFETGISTELVPLEGIKEMIDQAIKMFPDQALLHQSSGLLSIKENQLEAAVPKLEISVANDRFPIIPHLLLEHCHKTLGNSFTAHQHLTSANELMTKLPKGQAEIIRNHIKVLVGNSPAPVAPNGP